MGTFKLSFEELDSCMKRVLDLLPSLPAGVQVKKAEVSSVARFAKTGGVEADGKFVFTLSNGSKIHAPWHWRLIGIQDWVFVDDEEVKTE